MLTHLRWLLRGEFNLQKSCVNGSCNVQQRIVFRHTSKSYKLQPSKIIGAFIQKHENHFPSMRSSSETLKVIMIMS